MTDEQITTLPEASARSGLAPTNGVLAELRREYLQAHPRSLELHSRAVRRMPGGNSRSNLHFDPFPLYLVDGHAFQIEDADRYSYIDLVNNYTSLVHGHRHAHIVSALEEGIGRAWALGGPSPEEVGFSEELSQRVPSIRSVRFANSGTEATLYAVRTARQFTRRRLVAKAEGGYHGGGETLQASVKRLAEALEPAAEPGVTTSTIADTVVFPYNDIGRTRDVLRQAGSDLAAVIIEPVQGGAGALPGELSYLSELADVARDAGALVIFDEVMTLRLAYGGVQSDVGVVPDLTALGKIIGGGLPVGAFGGREDVMDVWNPKNRDPAYHAGTFNANRLTLAAGRAALELLTQQEIVRINDMGDALRDAINKAFRGSELPLVASGVGSIGQVHEGDTPPHSFRDAKNRNRSLVQCLHLLLLKQGIYTAPRGSFCLSTPMNEQTLEQISAAYEAAAIGLANLLK